MGKINYSAFRRGFAVGFSSPIRFVAGSRWHPSYRVTDTVGSAWAEVGRLLREELLREGAMGIGKRADQEATRKQRRAS